MIKSEPAIGFKFNKYRISNFSFDETGKEKNDYDIQFDPSGIYDETNGEYYLQLIFTAKDKEANNLAIKVTGMAEYQFDKPYKAEDLPSHFFLSAIPIFFPYIRAFVSNLTLQANMAVIVLGLINFTHMAEHLKQNTTVKR